MRAQAGKRGQATGTTKGIGAEQERWPWREPGAEARTWGARTGVMAGLVMMACGLRGAGAGMMQDSWHGWQTLDVNMNDAWRVQGARRHDGSDG